MLSLGALTMQIIDRGGRLGVRLKDMHSPARAAFKGLRYFPIKRRSASSARFVPHAKPRLDVPTVLGDDRNACPVPGNVSFDARRGDGGTPLRLDAGARARQTELFFIFRDKTAGKTTYGGGRFLYADMPRDGFVVLDFNRRTRRRARSRAHATCPLPPPKNRLPVAIDAGEMFAGQH